MTVVRQADKTLGLGNFIKIQYPAACVFFFLALYLYLTDYVKVLFIMTLYDISIMDFRVHILGGAHRFMGEPY